MESAVPLNPTERLLLLRNSRVKALRLLTFKLIKVLGVEIPVAVSTGRNLQLPHGAVGLVLHESTIIGDDVRLFPGVTLGRADQYLRPEQLAPGGRVEVQDRVVVGAGAKVLFRSGEVLVLGRDCVIGANAVVLRSVPAGEIWAGAPARRVSFNPNACA